MEESVASVQCKAEMMIFLSERYFTFFIFWHLRRSAFVIDSFLAMLANLCTTSPNAEHVIFSLKQAFVFVTWMSK